jgi:peptidoglycan/LPS O-acetylase OafA/YrhL
MSTSLTTLAAAVFLGGVALFDDYRVLGAVPLAYVFFWFATCFPWLWSMRVDLSYGVYICHWPTFQLITLAVPATLSTALFVPAGPAVVLAPAARSWYVIEKPALSWKNSTLPDPSAVNPRQMSR